MADLSVGELVHHAAKGAQDAWDRLVDEHSALVWSVIRSHRMRAGDAEDVFQTTWLRLVENLERIENPERLSSWLVTTARRECLRVLRRVQREVPDDDIDDAADGRHAVSPEPVDALLQREERVEVYRAYGALSERCQNVLRLTVLVPEAGYGDIAEALDMPVGSIGPTRNRCLRHLRRLLEAPDG